MTMNSHNNPQNVVILGCGYVGSRVHALFPQSLCTHRTVLPHGTVFKLEDKNTWSSVLASITPQSRVLWTFAAASNALSPALSLEFWDACAQGAHHIVLASTSCYLNQTNLDEVDENSDLDFSQPRVVAEEDLRRRGATVLALSGIVGPGRDPLRWLLDGRIHHGSPLVNLIHVEDIVHCIEKVWEKGLRGERYNVCDGRARSWDFIAEHYKNKGLLPKNFQFSETGEERLSKRVLNGKIKGILEEGYGFKLTI